MAKKKTAKRSSSRRKIEVVPEDLEAWRDDTDTGGLPDTSAEIDGYLTEDLVPPEVIGTVEFSMAEGYRAVLTAGELTTLAHVQSMINKLISVELNIWGVER